MRNYEREIDVTISQQMQESLRYILACFAEMVEKRTGKPFSSLQRRTGHQNLLLEKILRGHPPRYVVNIWRNVFKRTDELTLENLVDLVSEEYPLAKEEWKNFQECAADIINRHKGLAIKIAQNIASNLYHIGVEDLLGEAYLAIVGAALRFKPRFKTNFSTYAYYVIKSWLMDFASRSIIGISLPFTAYSEMRRQDNLITVYTSSQLEDLCEENNGENIIFNTSPEDALPTSPLNHEESDTIDMSTMEIMNIISKLPPPFKKVCYLIVIGEISSPADLRKLGEIDISLCKEIFAALQVILRPLI